MGMLRFLIALNKQAKIILFLHVAIKNRSKPLERLHTRLETVT